MKRALRFALSVLAFAIFSIAARSDVRDFAAAPDVYVGGVHVHAGDLITVARADDQFQGECTGVHTLRIAGATGVVTTGGTSSLTGTGFDATPFPGVVINTPTGPTYAKVTAATSTTITATIPPLSAGTYDVYVSNPGCGATTMRKTLVVSAVETPSVTLGLDLIGWYTGSSTWISGTTWTDQSSYSQNLTFNTAPTITASDANYNGQSSVTFDGSATKATNASYSLQGGTTLWTFCVYRTTSATGQRTITSYLPSSGGLAFHFYQLGGTSLIMNASGTTVTWPTSVATNVTYGSYGYLSAPTSTTTVGVEQAIGSNEAFTTAVLAIETTPGTFGIGVDTGNNNFFAGSLAECVVSRVVPSSSQYTKIYTYEQAKYAMDGAPTITASTTLPTAGGVVRIQGANYLNGATITADTLSTSGSTFGKSTVYEFTVAGGTYVSGTTYNETYGGPDTQTITAPNMLTVASSLDPWGICGNHLFLWLRADNVTCSGTCVNGSSVTGMTDLSRYGNDFAQGTGANQGTWNSANSNGNNQPSVHFTNATAAQYMKNTAVDYITRTQSTAVYLWVVGYENTNVSQCDLAALSNEGFFIFLNGSNIPSFKNSLVATVGTSQLGKLFSIYGYANPIPGGSGNVGVNLNNGTEGTTSGTTGGITNNTTGSIGASNTGTNSCKSDIFEVIGCNYAMGSTDKSNMETYLHGRYGSPL